MLKHIAAAVLFALMFLPFGHASTLPAPFVFTGIINCNLTSQSTINSCVSSTLTLFFGLVIVGVLLSLAVVALAYIVSKTFDIGRLEGWYKGELYETVKTLIILGSIVSVLIIMSGISLALAGGTAASGTGISKLISNFDGLWSAAYNGYITPTFQKSISATYIVGGLSVGVGALKSINIGITDNVNFEFFVLASGFNANLYTSSILESARGFSFLNALMDIIIIPVDILFGVLNYTFYIIVGVGLIGLIPIGIVLRAIPFLRGLGGTFIAMGIGLCLIYPSLLVLVNMPITNYLNNVLHPPVNQPATHNYPAILSYVQDIITGITNLLGKTFLATVGAFYTGFYTPEFGIYPVLNFSTYYAIGDVLQFILIAVDLLIGIIATDNIAKLMGGSVKLGIGKFKIA
jgi:hypothetical protein